MCIRDIMYGSGSPTPPKSTVTGCLGCHCFAGDKVQEDEYHGRKFTGPEEMVSTFENAWPHVKVAPSAQSMASECLASNYIVTELLMS